MFVLKGILCLIFLCASVLVFASFAISQFPKNNLNKTNEKNKDDYDYLFDIYG